MTDHERDISAFGVLTYACDTCRAAVELFNYSQTAYGYVCERCGRMGAIPCCDYWTWIEYTAARA